MRKQQKKRSKRNGWQEESEMVEKMGPHGTRFSLAYVYLQLESVVKHQYTSE